MSIQNPNSKFHELIGQLLVDHPFYEKCMVAQKFDVGSRDEVGEMSSAAAGSLVKPPYPVCLFQMQDYTTTHFFLVEDLSVDKSIDIRVVRFGKFTHGWEEPYMAIRIKGDGERREIYAFKDYECTESLTEMGNDEFLDMSSGKNGYAWTCHASLYLSECFAVMACKNVERKINEAPKFINSKRMQKGKLPFFSYWTLHIKTNDADHKSNSPPKGTHASPRLHLRRGHIRKLNGGGMVWVTHCLVGSKSIGSVQKEYKVSA